MELVKIQIRVMSAYEDNDPRNQRLKSLMQQQGYIFDFQPFSPPCSWQARGYHGDGILIKQYLRSQGFSDTDFKINVEYQRGWGFL